MKQKREKRRDPVENDVYERVFRDLEQHRRVIAVRDGRVCYSIGSDMNHWCNIGTFRRWSNGAKLTHDGRIASAGTQD